MRNQEEPCVAIVEVRQRLLAGKVNRPVHWGIKKPHSKAASNVAESIGNEKGGRRESRLGSDA